MVGDRETLLRDFAEDNSNESLNRNLASLNLASHQVVRISPITVRYKDIEWRFQSIFSYPASS